MNPPSALHGAMSRDRKPFTYTPGGLDLSEIKSSRMAARLMRNAMNEGVPELPKQHIQSPPMPSTPIAVPNYNCLPVQVFPAFNLPANPKSLLRTRSNPVQSRDLSVQKAPPPQPQLSPFVNNSRAPGATPYDTFNKNTPTYSQVNNNRPVSMYEYGYPASIYIPTSYEKESYAPVLPEISYDAEYFRATPKNNAKVETTVIPTDTVKSGNNIDNIFIPSITNQESIVPFQEPNRYQGYSEDIFKPEIKSSETTVPFVDTSQEYSDMLLKPVNENKETTLQFVDDNIYQRSFDDSYQIENKEINIPLSEIKQSENKFDSDQRSEIQSTVQSYNSLQINNDSENYVNSKVETNEALIDEPPKSSLDYSTFSSEAIVPTKPTEELADPDNQKKEVTVVKKQVIKQENNVEEQNGSSEQNGDSEVQAVIKLPAKKSATKTETKVEVTKKTLPDGSIEEVKKTITKTTVDGRTEIKTKTETTIIPKEDDEEEVEEVEEDEEAQEVEDDQAQVVEEAKVDVVKKILEESVKPKENGQENIIKTEERSETTTTSSKKLIIVQDELEEQNEEEEEEAVEEEIENTEPVTFVIKQPVEKSVEKVEPVQQEDVHELQEEEKEDEEGETQEEEAIIETKEDIKKEEINISLPVEKEEEQADEEVDEEEEYEEAEEKEVITKAEKIIEPVAETKGVESDGEPENVEQDVEVGKEEDVEKPTEKISVIEKEPIEEHDSKQERTQEITEEKQEVLVEKQEHKGEKKDVPEEILTPKIDKPEITEHIVPIREPSVPLEKVEDVEIKPIGLGDFLTKTRTENTEIITNLSEKPTGLLTEINRIENIVTVNRTVKTLDQSYENITQQGIPTLKTYFTPLIDKISTSPQPARPYQPVYPPEPTTERRHSLLLERLSVERQLPSDTYQNNYQYSSQTVEQQRQWSQEPQAEVLTVSNVKPSQITNQQWYQQKDNAIYNNVTTSPQPTQAAAPSWAQPKAQTQPLYKPQPQFQPSPQPQYQQTSPQPQYHQPSPQPQYHQPSPQPQYHQPAPQPQYIQTTPQPQYQAPPQPQTQYQPSYTEKVQENTSNSYQNTYSTFAPQPTNWASHQKPLSPIPTIITPSQPNQYSYLSKDSSESYQKTTDHYSSSSYVPPPWEQDSTYVAPETPQNFYQPPPQTSTFSPAPNQGWKPKLSTSKFSKPPPTAYIPPKPNQSFVAPVTHSEPPRMPGRKTYYSEYERRYISVPESTYVPGESKYQPQPDPSPAYYYDNNEPAETVEPQWRRELREFTEQSQSQTSTETNIKPPWEAEVKCAKTPEPTYTQTPTWSQTVRPQSWRERSFESEFVSQEWPKTNTLGRGRPLSSYGKESVPVRTRGVSVDRYNPNSYQSPVAAEHPPVQTHTHVPPAPHATGYHNPNVPAYHARASAEPREQVSYQQPRNTREVQASPFQSRSFKYLQWITGTED